jgi:CubicO group peptidase (beta-lactamase class C family)
MIDRGRASRQDEVAARYRSSFLEAGNILQPASHRRAAIAHQHAARHGCRLVGEQEADLAGDLLGAGVAAERYAALAERREGRRFAAGRFDQALEQAEAVLDPTVPNRADWRRAEIPAANGQASARGAAQIFAVLAAGGSLGRHRLLSPDGLARFTAPRGGYVDLLLGAAPPWAAGVGLNGMGLFGPNPRAYGHTGWSGSFVSADPDAGIAIAYVCNQMGQELIGDPRARALAAEIHRCLAAG